MSDTYIGVRIDSETKKKLGELAEKEKRSLSSYLRVVLADFVKAVDRVA